MTPTRQMRAAMYENYGPPSRLKIVSTPIPAYAEDEVLIQVRATTVNRTDCGFLRGQPFIVRFFSGLTRPKNKILGCEFAGEVVAIGGAVTQFEVGDRVVGFKDDDHGFGGHAEYTTMPASAMLVCIPDKFDYHQAAPALEGAHYALKDIREADLSSGDNVLINGATGAIGSAAVQIIHDLGARVTAVCSGEDLELVLGLGAEKVIDYNKQDFTKLDDKFDLVFDAVGKSTFAQCKKILTDKGIYTSTELGPFAQNPILALLTARSNKKRVQFPIPQNKKADAVHLCELMARGAYTPLIDTSYSLERIEQAFNYVETGMKKGNVVVTIDSSANH